MLGMQGNGTLVPSEARELQRELFRDISQDAGYSRTGSKYTGVSYIKVDYIAAFFAADPAHAIAFQRLASATEAWMMEADSSVSFPCAWLPSRPPCVDVKLPTEGGWWHCVC